MDVAGKVIVVTGGASGIGAAIARRFARESPRAIVLADIDGVRTAQVARTIDALALQVDVSYEQDIAELVRQTIDRFGRIDIFCSNAGVFEPGALDLPPQQWDRSWSINVMAHVHAARYVVPGMLAQGGGHLVQMASAAGLLCHLDSPAYSVTKHAVVAFAEWLSIRYGRRGLGVSCVCPLGVQTPMLKAHREMHARLDARSVSAEVVADVTVDAVRHGRFMVLPHGEVQRLSELRVSDRDRWMSNMRLRVDREAVSQ